LRPQKYIVGTGYWRY